MTPRIRRNRTFVFLALLGFVPAALAFAGAPGLGKAREASTHKAKGARTNMEKTTTVEKATFAAGCFWGVEAAFRQIKGVVSTQVGYTGGRTANPSYEDVCTDRTGHAEAVEVTYDPARVSYDDLLSVFWTNHDPTTPNRQGPDVGEQYRSAIFFHSPAQESAAKASVSRLQAEHRFKRPITTQILAAGPFYRAEDYHQQYLEKRGLSVCHIK